jgi:hypothetical protein
MRRTMGNPTRRRAIQVPAINDAASNTKRRSVRSSDLSDLSSDNIRAMRAVSLEDTFTFSRDTMFRALDGGAVTLNLGSATYFGLNEVGARLLALVAGLADAHLGEVNHT